MCEENISILLKWINDVEQRVSKIGGPQENFEELQVQINVLKVNVLISCVDFAYFHIFAFP